VPVGQVGVGTLDEVGGAVLRRQCGEADLDLARIGVGREREVDGAEALAGILDRRTGLARSRNASTSGERGSACAPASEGVG
jgi:hypothetical protein